MDRVEEPIEVIQSIKVQPSGAQVTKVKIAGQVAYVRENVRDGENILELCAPEPWWIKIASIIVVEDDRKRKVLPNPEFTREWAEEMVG